LAPLTKLTELNLDSTNISDESIETLLKFQNLERLNLRGCQMSEEGFKQLSKLKKLKWLNVANTSVGGVIDELTDANEELEVVDF